ncbi:MAG TPA: ABC transporter substrate-binding protein [Chloroflexota bacterium]|nr:ABC transporter substrate-binding protein [Chloroflexota bacterium]
MSSTSAPLIPPTGISRRDFLRMTAVGAAAVAAGPALAGSAEAAGPKRGGTLRLGDTGDITTFEPYATSTNWDIWTMLLVYDQLTRPTTDGLNIEPSLASSWDISDGGKTYTFHLRHGVKYHDGTELTAEDVKFCVERAVFQKNSQWEFILAAFKGMDVVDKYTVRAHLKQPHAPFLSDMALFATSVYPKSAFEKMGTKLWHNPIGTGPFKFVSWKLGSELILKRNPDFWRKDGTPYIDEYHRMVVTDDNARVLQVQSGELDICLFPPLTQVKALQSNPQVVIHVSPFMSSYFVTMNVTKKPFTDKRVRQALNYATDKQALIQKILFGYGKPSGQALPLMFGNDPSIQPYPYDPKKAKDLLKAAGYGSGVSFTMVTNAGSTLQLEQALQQQWKQVGVNMAIQQVDPNTLTKQIENPPYNYQISPGYMTSDIIDPDELVSFAMAGNGGTEAIWTLYNNKTVNDLAAKGAETLDRAQRQKIYYELDRIHHDDAPMVFLYTEPSVTLSTPAVQGFKVLPTGNFRLEHVWLNS